MKQNPDLHVGPSHLTIKSLQVIKQVGAIFCNLRKVIPDLRTLVSGTIYSKAIRIYFWLN